MFRSLIPNTILRRTVAVSGLILLLVMLFFILLGIHTQPVPLLTKLPFSSQSRVGLKDNYLYSFNGIGFMKTDITSGETKTLLSGLRVPTIGNIWWAGDEGALVTFSGSLYGTQVYDRLIQDPSSLNYSVFSQYVWYIDFSAKTISLVSTIPLYQNIAYYNSRQHLFYYVTEAYSEDDPVTNPDQQSEPDEEQKQIRTYTFNPKSATSSLISIDMPLSFIGTVAPCDDTGFCLIGMSGDKKQSIIQLKGGAYTTVYSNSDAQYIIPTNNQDVFYLAYPTDTSTDGDYSDDPKPFRLSYWEKSSGKVSDTNILTPTADTLSIMHGLESTEVIYPEPGTQVAQSSTSIIGLRSVITKTIDPKIEAGEVISYGTTNSALALVSNMNGDFSLLSLEPPKLPHDSEESIASSISACLSQGSNILAVKNPQDSSNYLLSIPVSTDDSTTSLDLLSDCLMKRPKQVFGITFTITESVSNTARDPDTGFPDN